MFFGAFHLDICYCCMCVFISASSDKWGAIWCWSTRPALRSSMFFVSVSCVFVSICLKKSYTQSDHCLLSSHDMVDYLVYSAKTYSAVLFTGVTSREVADERLCSSKSSIDIRDARQRINCNINIKTCSQIVYGQESRQLSWNMLQK